MSTLYEIVELANGDIALQKEGDAKAEANSGSKRAPLVTMRFSTDLVRFLRTAKMDVAKVMIEAGLERVANLAESVSREELESKIEEPTRFDLNRHSSLTTAETTTNLDRRSTDNSFSDPAGNSKSETETAYNRLRNTSKSDSKSSSFAQPLQAAKAKNISSNKTNVSNRRLASSLHAGHKRNRDAGPEKALEFDDQHPTVSHLLH